MPIKKHTVKFKKDFTETVVHDDPKRTEEIEKNYSMEYIPGPPGKTGQWLYNIKNPETGEVIEQRATINGNWRCVWRKEDEQE